MPPQILVRPTTTTASRSSEEPSPRTSPISTGQPVETQPNASNSSHLQPTVASGVARPTSPLRPHINTSNINQTNNLRRSSPSPSSASASPSPSSAIAPASAAATAPPPTLARALLPLGLPSSSTQAVQSIQSTHSLLQPDQSLEQSSSSSLAADSHHPPLDRRSTPPTHSRRRRVQWVGLSEKDTLSTDTLIPLAASNRTSTNTDQQHQLHLPQHSSPTSSSKTTTKINAKRISQPTPSELLPSLDSINTTPIGHHSVSSSSLTSAVSSSTSCSPYHSSSQLALLHAHPPKSSLNHPLSPGQITPTTSTPFLSAATPTSVPPPGLGANFPDRPSLDQLLYQAYLNQSYNSPQHPLSKNPITSTPASCHPATPASSSKSPLTKFNPYFPPLSFFNQTSNSVESASPASPLRPPRLGSNMATPDSSRPGTPDSALDIPFGERDGLPANPDRRPRTFTREAARLVSLHKFKFGSGLGGGTGGGAGGVNSGGSSSSGPARPNPKNSVIMSPPQPALSSRRSKRLGPAASHNASVRESRAMMAAAAAANNGNGPIGLRSANAGQTPNTIVTGLGNGVLSSLLHLYNHPSSAQSSSATLINYASSDEDSDGNCSTRTGASGSLSQPGPTSGEIRTERRRAVRSVYDTPPDRTRPRRRLSEPALPTGRSAPDQRQIISTDLSRTFTQHPVSSRGDHHAIEIIPENDINPAKLEQDTLNQPSRPPDATIDDTSRPSRFGLIKSTGQKISNTLSRFFSPNAVDQDRNVSNHASQLDQETGSSGLKGPGEGHVIGQSRDGNNINRPVIHHITSYTSRSSSRCSSDAGDRSIGIATGSEDFEEKSPEDEGEDQAETNESRDAGMAESGHATIHPRRRSIPRASRDTTEEVEQDWIDLERNSRINAQTTMDHRQYLTMKPGRLSPLLGDPTQSTASRLIGSSSSNSSSTGSIFKLRLGKNPSMVSLNRLGESLKPTNFYNESSVLRAKRINTSGATTPMYELDDQSILNHQPLSMNMIKKRLNQVEKDQKEKNYSEEMRAKMLAKQHASDLKHHKKMLRKEEKERKKAQKKNERQRQDEILITLHVAEILKRQEFILQFTRALMMFGGPSHRLESQIATTARALEIDLQVVLIYSLCIFSFQDEATHTSETRFIKQSGSLDLGKLTDLATLHWEVMNSKIEVHEASQEISRLMRAKARKQKKKKLILRDILMGGLCSMMIGPAAFAASLSDMAISFGLGSVLVGMQIWIESIKSESLMQVFEILMTGIISFVGAGLASTGSFCYEAIVGSSIVLILPGWLVCCAALELQSRSIVSGSVRLVWAMIYARLGIGLGAEFWMKVSGQSIRLSDHGTCGNMHDPHLWYRKTVPDIYKLIFVPGYSIFLSLKQGARVISKEFIVMVVISIGGWSVNHFSSVGFHNNRTEFSSALGSFFVGLSSNIYGRLFQGTGFIVGFVPILFQLPSGLGNDSGLLSFAKVEDNFGSNTFVNGFQVGQQLIEVSLGLVIGLFMATVLVYPFGNKRGGLMTF